MASFDLTRRHLLANGPAALDHRCWGASNQVAKSRSPDRRLYTERRDRCPSRVLAPEFAGLS